jgi:hypothetical protein
VFVRDYRGREQPSVEEVAKIKAESFGKKLFPHQSTLAKAHGLTCSETMDITYSINGSSSSFRFGEVTIYFKRICQRKISLQESPAGKAIVALWHIGDRLCDQQQIMHAMDKFHRSDRKEFRQLVPRTTAWLSDYFAA